jgi:hypothetical protein
VCINCIGIDSIRDETAFEVPFLTNVAMQCITYYQGGESYNYQQIICYLGSSSLRKEVLSMGITPNPLELWVKKCLQFVLDLNEDCARYQKSYNGTLFGS